MTENTQNQNLEYKAEKDPIDDLDGISLIAVHCWLILGLVAFAKAFQYFIQNIPEY